ncbi:hypothetical protein E2C01_020153 [Portunus trituberculatus]|uniref:Uncharacterized protein n=1 Tax=Portunus trituberculatus TaxID=210409 RepID=A0A5B7DZ77_PORTR|nr:hypothetical protein [Portunus trituberculatus]
MVKLKLFSLPAVLQQRLHCRPADRSFGAEPHCWDVFTLAKNIFKSFTCDVPCVLLTETEANTLRPNEAKFGAGEQRCGGVALITRLVIPEAAVWAGIENV